MSDFEYLEKAKNRKSKYRAFKYIFKKCADFPSLLISNISNKYLTKLSKEDIVQLKKDIYDYRNNVLKFLSSCSFVFLYFNRIFDNEFLDFIVNENFKEFDKLLEFEEIIEEF